MADIQTFNIHQLARLLHKSPSTIRNDLVRAPWRIPVPVRIGGVAGGRLIWEAESVRAWLASRTAPAVPPPGRPAPAKRGRPTKMEMLARARPAGLAAGVAP
jgi:hypothetical protein